MLAPEGIKPAALMGGHKAVGGPGGAQAMRRAETVTVSVGAREFALRPPNPAGSDSDQSAVADEALGHANDDTLPFSHIEDIAKRLADENPSKGGASGFRPWER